MPIVDNQPAELDTSMLDSFMLGAPGAQLTPGSAVPFVAECQTIIIQKVGSFIV